MRWTRLDIALVSLPLLIALILTGSRVQQEVRLRQAASQMNGHIQSIAAAVEYYHSKTNRYFPEGMRIYLNRFSSEPGNYQGIKPEWMYLENNAGMVMELIRYDTVHDRFLPDFLFSQPFEMGDPYVRILLDYGDSHGIESEVLTRVQRLLPPGAVAKIEDHFYVIDLRKLMHAES